jgi:large subunit ribosomal protein L6
MSRIGKKPVPIGKAKVTVNNQKINVEGPKGKLELNVHPLIKVANQDGNLVVTRPDDEKQSKALHGLTRALLANMIEGVTNGYRKALEIQGVGYKAEQRGKNLVLSVGYANPVTVAIPGNVTVKLEGANKIEVTGADKQAVGEFAARVRKIRKPEPYKGKGIRYEGEQVKIKPGKAFAGAGAAK